MKTPFSNRDTEPIPSSGGIVLVRAMVVGAFMWLAATMLFSNSWRRTIVGDSMAPHLVGSHLRWTCPDCRFSFVTTLGEQGGPMTPAVRDAAWKAWDTDATCPNCGLRNIQREHARPRGAQTALVESNRPVQRFDLVAYKTREGVPMVKRLLGLPGEHVRLQDGDLWIDGRRLQKSPHQSRQLAILVNDGCHESRHVPRWRAEPSQHWRQSGCVRTCLGNGQLIYQHRVSYESFRPRRFPSPVRDQYAFNLFASRQPRVVGDLSIEVWLKLQGDQSVWLTLSNEKIAGRPGQVVFRGSLRGDSLRWSVEDVTPATPAGKAEMKASQSATRREIAWESGENPPWRHAWAGVVDGRAILVCGGNVVLECPTERISGDGIAIPEGEVARISFRSHQGPATAMVTGMRVWRDLHYDAVRGQPSQWQLGPDQWFLLGDNIPVSIDSRQTGPVPANRWLGKVRVE